MQYAGCTRVTLARRVFCAIAMASGFDVSTLPELSWGDLDPVNRTLYEARPKTSKPVFVYANPAWLFDLLDVVARALGRTPRRRPARRPEGCPHRRARLPWAGAGVGRPRRSGPT